jgi:transglutaminase-like putative cysteine protease
LDSDPRSPARPSAPSSEHPPGKEAASPYVRRWSITIPALILVAIPLASIAYKVFVLDYRLQDVLPETEYRVAVEMSLDGNNGRVRARTFLPVSDGHQTISDVVHTSDPAFRFSEESVDLNRVGTWFGTSVPDGTQFSYSFSVRAQGKRYEFGPDLQVPSSYPESMEVYLQPEEDIQVDDAEIQAALVEIGADTGTLPERLQRIYDFTAGLSGRPFSGTTDALTALRLGEASCNGKSRLFVALARASGIPARLVGGFILESGRKRTSHQWVEAYVGGHWVPYCPTNGYYATLPTNYLVFYRGDHALFRYTADVNFDYGFVTTARQVPAARALETFKAFNVWALFDRLELPFSLLRTVLMLPLGALIVVIFRNVIGVPTFGTFLPALIAAAAGETGLFWGLIAISLVMLMVAVVRLLLQRFGLLHSPTLAILLAVVVLTMLGTSLVAEQLQITNLTRISYFPIAVMAIASERFYLSLVEQGVRTAFKELAGTLVVVLSCYLVMNSLAMQVLVSGFPEILLLAIAANMYLGRWIGVRVLELIRFRRLLTTPKEHAAGA